MVKLKGSWSTSPRCVRMARWDYTTPGVDWFWPCEIQWNVVMNQAHRAGEQQVVAQDIEDYFLLTSFANWVFSLRRRSKILKKGRISSKDSVMEHKEGRNLEERARGEPMLSLALLLVMKACTQKSLPFNIWWISIISLVVQIAVTISILS